MADNILEEAAAIGFAAAPHLVIYPDSGLGACSELGIPPFGNVVEIELFGV